jgi:membrane protease YdiL (CAAX protease family)
VGAVGLGGLTPNRRTGRTVGWTVLVTALASINYADRFASGKPPKDVLYQWSTAIGSAALFGVILGIVLALANGDLELLALRRPVSWPRAALQMFGVLVGIYVISLAVSPFLHPGREQGLTPDRWDSSRAAPFLANAFVVCVVAPFTEELTFRGLGFSLLRPLGAVPAVLLTALAFGLAHGLVDALPVLFAFGVGLAYIRLRQDSVVPGMVLHGLFNAIALAIAVST